MKRLLTSPKMRGKKMVCEHKGMFGVVCADDANMVADPVDMELYGEEFLVFLCSAHKDERARDI